ncbi:PfkB family carbohydrate kinase [Solwaraspora sp. WMMD406]|nr:PfkB family carbohydrate kinase [Solwaraspora sp. WMMD406]MDG4762550.1 PfkB family carbohydrate kinase [Solwaraspora sp. WMMD406]
MPVEVVDTVGAGDAFCAGLVDALVSGLDLARAARAATVSAAAAVTTTGAQSRVLSTGP